MENLQVRRLQRYFILAKVAFGSTFYVNLYQNSSSTFLQPPSPKIEKSCYISLLNQGYIEPAYGTSSGNQSYRLTPIGRNYLITQATDWIEEVRRHIHTLKPLLESKRARVSKLTNYAFMSQYLNYAHVIPFYILLIFKNEDIPLKITEIEKKIKRLYGFHTTTPTVKRYVLILEEKEYINRIEGASAASFVYNQAKTIAWSTYRTAAYKEIENGIHHLQELVQLFEHIIKWPSTKNLQYI
ncbi:hypothetical protein RYX45_04975 [Alkalihalophilus pseudofirmus]|uniref:Uncharacterized protein n=1 Tax=Alkalihalophilus pseudofirmus TaxID=79885 RepID=A0AAJ2KWL6_ALKPS|nr:hypothetical protein [Alkalihalophilus pseudofirmus]MDV2884521.1 hypothetical protein [Alkalihalophilus pseudofirmus]